MATELGKSFIASWKASKQLQGDSRKQAEAGWNAVRSGADTGTKLSEFESNKNTRYARDVIGWDKSQDLRKKAEAADVGATPPPGGRYDRRYNYSTGEMEWVEKDPSNFWKANKDELIRMGGALLGGVLLGPGGIMLGSSLAGAGRDIYKTRQARRELRDDRRDYQYQQAMDQQAAEEARRANMGNLFRSGGEGVVEYATNDLSKKKKDQYVRQNV